MLQRNLFATVTLAVSAALPFASLQLAHAQTAAGQSAASGKVAAADQKMMQDLGEGNLAEIATGKLAEQKGSRDDVKQFGAMMVQDHTKALQQLQTVATSRSVKLPESPNAKHEKAAKELASLSGDKFDQRYATMMVADHRETLALLKKIQSSAKDEELKKLATETTPVVTQHLEHAQKLAGSAKK